MKKTLYVFVWACISLLALPAAAQVPAYVPTDGLVGWWPFNGNANDESGNGNDGTVNGATLTEDRFGISNSSYSFDGISNFIQTADSPSLSFIEDFTISAWIKQSTTTTNYNTILNKRLGGNWSYNLSISNILGGSGEEINKLISGRRNNDGAQTEYRFSNTPTSFDAWQHMLVVVKNDTLKFYLDGADAGYINGYNGAGGYVPFGNSFSIPMINQPVGITIGDCNCGGSEHMNGLIDDVALYNRALNEQEIQNLYTGTTPPPCAALPSNLQQGLVDYWPFCGNANDESGNGNDGTVNGATLTEDRFGNAGSAFEFSEAEQNSIDVGNNPNFNFESNSNFTISLWTKNNSVLSINSYAIGYYMYKGNGGGDNKKWLFGDFASPYSNGNFAYVFHSNDELGNSNWLGDSITHEPDLIDWNHIVISKEDSIFHLFKNGQLINNETIDNYPNYYNDSNLFFGRGENVTMNAKLDDIGIWTRALTPEEVQELYTLDACTFTVYDTLTVYETVYDTVYTYETTYDTVTTYVTVTDTLLIDITFTGFEGQPSWLNTVTVFPNPASDQITIDYGNFGLMAGYNTIITDAAGAAVYSSAVNSQQAYIDINAWGAAGVYYMTIYDASGAAVAVRHIVLE
jgi:hypothetical protein